MADDPRAIPRGLRWSLALDLLERLGLEPAPTGGGERGRRRLERWRLQKPFADHPDLWRRRLDQAETTEGELAALLEETEEDLATRLGEMPAWAAEIEATYGGAEPDPEPFPWPAGANLERCPFVPLVEPLVRRAVDGLRAAAEAVVTDRPDAPFEPAAAVAAFTVMLPDLLTVPLNRALMVELNIARLEERLEGDGPAERFASFVAQLRQPGTALEILRQYPVLARLAVTRIDQWRRAGEAFLRHLAEDADELASAFASARAFADDRPLGRLARVEGDVSDPHRDGRGVLLVAFDSGVRAVYKPKSMAVEAAFQDLLAWLNARGFEPAFRTLAVIDGDDHGWMEWVETGPCADDDELRRFYLRQGANLALLYFLDGTDFHQENLLAAGEHPVLIDLETLFQPWISGGALTDVDRQPGAAVASTVLRSNLLPDRWWGDADNPGVDLSGLAAKEGQLTPRPVMAVADRGTDTMRVERRRVEIPLGDAQPRMAGGGVVSVLDHADVLEEGFRRLWHVVARHRDDLLADSGPLATFAEAEVRILFRTTASYGVLLLEGSHPHVLGDALERERHLDRLWQQVPERPYLPALIPWERRDLARGDVPLFVGRPGSREVWSWDGESLGELFDRTELDAVRSKIAAADPVELERQLAVVRDAFEVVRLGSGNPPRASFHLAERAEPVGEDELLSAAGRVVERLLERAFETSEEILWLTPDYAEPAGWRIAPTGPDVFRGLPGIALFLAYWGDLTGDERATGAAAKALATAARQVEDDGGPLEGLGLWNGWGGLVYAFTHLGVLWGDDRLLDQAEEFARRLAPQLVDDDLLDLVAGAAGAVAAVLGLHAVRPSDELVEIARAGGDRLLETAEPQAAGLGWRMPLAGDRALAGISHGAAGIALALLRLAEVTGDDRYRAAALEGIEFERHLFVPELGNWPDLRAGAADEVGGHAHTMVAWCHGAPGVGLARVAGLPHLDDPAVRGEIGVAVATTLSGLGQNHCLCHGDLGNLDFLLRAARVTGDRDLERRVYRLAGGVVDSTVVDGWLHGLPGNPETPGLMVGLAGIGYGLARLAAPERLPSILEAAPPPGVGATDPTRPPGRTPRSGARRAGDAATGSFDAGPTGDRS